MTETECPKCKKTSEESDWYQDWDTGMGREIKNICPYCGYELKENDCV